MSNPTTFFREKAVFVAGGSGFVGQNLCHRLSQLGARVTATYYHHPPKESIPNVRFEYCNLLTADAVTDLMQGHNFAFHCAAFTGGASVITDSELDLMNQNVLMNTYFLQAAWANKLEKLAWISSNVVYPPSDQPMAEDDVTGQVFNKYFGVANMKLFGEKQFGLLTQKTPPRIPSVVVRPGNIYGPYDHFGSDRAHVLPALIQKAITRQAPFEIWGDGEDIKDFIYVDDFMDGLILAFCADRLLPPLNLASGQSVRLKDLVPIILDEAGYGDATIQYRSDKPSMIPVRRIDIQKAKQTLGFEPKTSIESGLRQTVRWAINNQNQTQTRETKGALA